MVVLRTRLPLNFFASTEGLVSPSAPFMRRHSRHQKDGLEGGKDGLDVRHLEFSGGFNAEILDHPILNDHGKPL